jgi:hypothetical protein
VRKRIVDERARRIRRRLGTGGLPTRFEAPGDRARDR